VTVTSRFDRIWETWPAGEAIEQARQHADERRRFLAALERCVREAAPAVVVEVGCGSAIDLALLARAAPVLALGVDFSAPGVAVARDVARRLDARVCFCVGDTFALPLRPRSVGLLFSQGLLEHFRDARPALVEQARAVAPGGALVVSVPQAFTGYTLHKRRAIAADTWPWGWEDQYSAARLRRLGADAGLVTEAVFGYQYWRAWTEPAWVLRDLVGKVERRLPGCARSLAAPASRTWDRAWTALERRLGHWFLQNVVAVFRVPGGASAHPAP
jgi:SAM-dependent methyltransferase